jgi:oxygen-independent coproporphyrinogen-3 oxidase
MAAQYVTKLCDAVSIWGEKLNDKSADTIYFGGGTPNLIGHDNIIKIINVVKKNFGQHQLEISMEINPCSCENIDFKLLREAGLNRVSVGAQSINDNELFLLGRTHTFRDVQKCLYTLKSSGINNISFDLMLGVQEQNSESLNRSLNFCIHNNIDHISAYMLKIEKGTHYYKIRKKLSVPCENEEADMYLETNKILKSAGYTQYEISNFCFDNKKCHHNLKYWNLDEYLGLGPSAHSFINNKRFYYSSSVTDFLNKPQILPEPCANQEQEYIMLRLRLNEGLVYDQFEEKFGYSIPQAYIFNAQKYVKTAFLILDKSGIRLTPAGFLVSNKIISDIIY